MNIAGLLASLVILAATGCGQFPICPSEYSANPSVRMRQLLNESIHSDPQQVVAEEWLRNWDSEHPLHLNPQRIHGGIQ